MEVKESIKGYVAELARQSEEREFILVDSCEAAFTFAPEVETPSEFTSRTGISLLADNKLSFHPARSRQDIFQAIGQLQNKRDTIEDRGAVEWKEITAAIDALFWTVLEGAHKRAWLNVED